MPLSIRQPAWYRLPFLAVLLLGPGWAWAHGPLFSFNPRTEFAGANVYEADYHIDQSGGEAESEYALAYKRGITSDLTVGLEAPYRSGELRDTVADPAMTAKYRFYRQANGPRQRSWTVLGGVRPDVVADDGSGGSGFAALAYGYESLSWYRWASAGVRTYAENDAGIDPGDTLAINVAGGWRPRTPVYGQPDLVFVTGINAEIQRQATAGGSRLADTGGTEVFASPGFIWTYGRHFQLRHGIQIPVYSDLNGQQAATDFRALLEVEMHY